MKNVCLFSPVYSNGMKGLIINIENRCKQTYFWTTEYAQGKLFCVVYCFVDYFLCHNMEELLKYVKTNLKEKQQEYDLIDICNNYGSLESDYYIGFAKEIKIFGYHHPSYKTDFTLFLQTINDTNPIDYELILPVVRDGLINNIDITLKTMKKNKQKFIEDYEKTKEKVKQKIIEDYAVPGAIE